MPKIVKKASERRVNGFYPYEDTQFPSVTKITRFVGDTEGLMRWVCRMGGLGVLWALRRLSSPEEFLKLMDSPSVVEWAKEHAVHAYESELERTATFGKKVHFGVESYLTKATLSTAEWSESEKKALETFVAFYQHLGGASSIIEEAVFCPSERFAGKPDFCNLLDEGACERLKPYLMSSSEVPVPGFTVCDFKTGSFQKSDHGMQTGAYRAAILASKGVLATGALIVNIERENPEKVQCFYFSAATLQTYYEKGFLHALRAWETLAAPQWYQAELRKAA